MDSEQPAPQWLWRLVAGGFAALLAAVVGLAVALALGAADPPRAGPRIWQDDFKAGAARWQFVAQGAQIGPQGGALVIDLAGRPSGAEAQSAAALTARPSGDFTVEMAGAQTSGALGAKYGLLLGWRDAAHYSAVLVNGNGYAEAYTLEDGQRRTWFEWQQWPNLLFGTDANRVRADVAGGQVTVRINDEVLVTGTANTDGEIGVLAQDSVAALSGSAVAPGDGSAAPSRVVISWVQVWGKR
jgi:hypothetical protein